MTILFNACGWKPAYKLGGPILATSPIAERLVARGHRVMVAATDSNLTERLDVDTERWHIVDGVEVRYFRMCDSWTKRIPADYFRKSNADYRTPDLSAWLESCGETFDIVHSHLPFIHSNRVCSKYASRTGSAYFYSQHGVFDPIKLTRRAIKKRAYLALYELAVCRRADALIALTQNDAASYRALGLQNRIEVVPNGVELPAARRLDWPFDDFSVEAGEPLILFMSRLHPMKGADIALRAFASARRRLPHGKLLVAGPDEYDLAQGLRQDARALGIENSVAIVGAIEGETKSAVLHRADLFVLPTESEGFSIAILEAMANACAVLTTPGAYFPAIESSEAGRIVERDVSAFANAMVEMCSKQVALAESGARARTLVESDYSWDGIVDVYESLYEELSAGARSANVDRYASAIP